MLERDRRVTPRWKLRLQLETALRERDEARHAAEVLHQRVLALLDKIDELQAELDRGGENDD